MPIKTTKEQIWRQFLETHDNSGSINGRDSKLSQKVLTLDAHQPEKFQPPTPSSSKVIGKSVHF